MDETERAQRLRDLQASVLALLADEDDWIAALATVVCEIHHALPYSHWTGFYRTIAPEMLAIGPYQGGHGCTRIPFSRGVCGAAARTRTTQLVPDVHQFPDHIACASTTQSEIVVPVLSPAGEVLAVLDLDSDAPAAFDRADQAALEAICDLLGRQFPLGELGVRAP
jgi:GAF domain-containing protein